MNYSDESDDGIESALFAPVNSDAPDSGKKKCVDLNDPEQRTYLKDWVFLFLLGTITNFGYVVVNSSAEDIADDFNEQNLLGLIPWANIFFGFFIRGKLYVF